MRYCSKSAAFEKVPLMAVIQKCDGPAAFPKSGAVEGTAGMKPAWDGCAVLVVPGIILEIW